MIKIKKNYSIVVMIYFITAFTILGADNIEGRKSSLTIKNGKENSALNDTIDTDNITFDFPNTELVVFARFVSKLCVKTLIGEELLKGNITLKSQKKMNLKQVKEVFKLILNSKGLEYTETNVYMEIIPISDSIVKVYNIKFLKSADITKALTQIFRMSFKVGNQPTTIQITSNDETNSVIVLAPKSQQIEIEKSIKELDVMGREVLLNIKIVELTRSNIFGYGLGLTYNPKAGDVVRAGITSGSSPFYPATGTLESFTTKDAKAAAGFQNHGTVHINVQGVDKKTNIKVLSQPRITAKENEKATLKIGEKQNYISGSSSLGGSTEQQSTTGTTQTTATNELGIEIEITPRIDRLNNVILELKLKIASVVGSYPFQTDVGIPIIGSRVINNSSSVMDGETLIIGGLLKNEKTTSTTMPPVIGQIPLVGWLFSKENEVAEQIELMVFITPTVIDSIETNKIALKNEVNKLRDYDPKNKATINQMLTGKKSKTDDVFNVFDYFNDGKYRRDQHFIQQSENL